MRDKVLLVVSEYIHSKPMANKITDEIMVKLIPIYFDAVTEAVKDALKVLQGIKKRA